MAPPTAVELISGIQQTLARQGLDYEALIRSFGQVPASERRERGGAFLLRDHLRGLILSQLSKQRPWGPIASNLAQIDRIFLHYDPDGLEAARPDDLINALRTLHCANLSIHAQMTALARNIETLRRIAEEYGSVDAFVVSNDPHVIARRLSSPGEFKLQQVGYTLALEYLRNVGIRAAKPDVHVCRVISAGRLGYTAGDPTPEEAYRTVDKLAREADCNATYLDNLLWLFCAQDYGEVCRADPRCGICAFRSACNFPRLKGTPD
jgi:hypothetical protein